MATKILISLALAFMFLACSSPQKPEAISPNLKHIIFIPGYYGTRLVKQTNGGPEVVWINVSQTLWGGMTLAMHGLGVPGASELTPTTVLDRVSVIPVLYSVNFYGNIIDTLRDHFKNTAQVHTLPYDWRRDYFSAVQLLDKKIKNLQSKGVKKISIVAHSMGGLVTSYYLRYGNQRPELAEENWQGAKNIEKVIIANTPFKGSMLMFSNMKWGDVFAGNTTLTSAEALSTFASSYELLPYYKGAILNDDLKPANIDLFDPKNWESNNWGLYKKRRKGSAGLIKKRSQWTNRALKKAKEVFIKILQSQKTKAKLKTQLLYFYGYGQKGTYNKAVFLSKENGGPDLLFKKDEFKKRFPDNSWSLLLADGDGSVTTESAQMPSAYKEALDYQEVKYKGNHTKAYDNKDVIKRVLRFLE